MQQCEGRFIVPPQKHHIVIQDMSVFLPQLLTDMGSQAAKIKTARWETLNWKMVTLATSLSCFQNYLISLYFQIIKTAV